MRRRVASAVLSAFALLLLLVTHVRAEPVAPVRLETMVPGSTLVFAGLEDVGRWGERWKATALAKLIAEPEMQAFGKPIVEDVKKLIREGEPAAPGEPAPESPVPPGLAQALEVLEQLQGLSGQAAVALVGWPKDGEPSVAACLDFGDHLGDFVAFLKRLETSLKEKGDAAFTSTVRGERTWWSVGPAGEGVQATTVGTAIFVSTDPIWLETVVSSGAAAVKGSLAEQAPFRRVRERSGASDAALFAFVNVPEVLERVPMPEDARRIANALGLDAIHGVGYGCAFRGDGFLDTLVIDAPPPVHGLFSVLKAKPVSHAALAMAPSTALYYTETGLAVAEALPKVREVAAKIDPETAPRIERFFAEANEVLGVDLEKDLLAGLADDLAFWVGLPPTGGLYPEAALCARVDDAKAFEATMTKAVEGVARRAAKDGRVSVATRTLDYRGTPLHVVDLADASGREMIPFTPTWALLGEHLVVTLVPHTMKEIVLRRAAKEAGLGGEEDVRSLLREAPEGHGGFEYLDVQAITTFVYDTGVPALQTAVKPNMIPIPVRLDWAQLPASRTVRPYLRSVAVYTTTDDEGLRLAVHSPVPLLPPLAMAAAAAALFVGERHGPRARAPEAVPLEPVDPADRAMAEGQLRMLADAVEMYLLENGKVPERLDLLLEKAKGSQEPYLARLPLDPWRQPFDYATPSTTTYRLSSSGPDRTWGTPDDLVHPAGTGK